MYNDFLKSHSHVRGFPARPAPDFFTVSLHRYLLSVLSFPQIRPFHFFA